MPYKHQVKDFYNQYASYMKERRQFTSKTRKYIEHPAVLELIGSINEKDILSVGCGSGLECHNLKETGAKSVTGIDLASEQIRLAKEAYSAIEFLEMDAEDLRFEDSTFDIVISSMTYHYLESWEKALNEASRVLKKGGVFVFSVLHPIRTASESIYDDNTSEFRLGYHLDKSNRVYTPYGNYLEKQSANLVWDKNKSMPILHRPMSAMVNDILLSGFTLNRVLEPKAIEETKKDRPAFWELRQKHPQVIVFKLIK